MPPYVTVCSPRTLRSLGWLAGVTWGATVDPWEKVLIIHNHDDFTNGRPQRPSRSMHSCSSAHWRRAGIEGVRRVMLSEEAVGSMYFVLSVQLTRPRWGVYQNFFQLGHRDRMYSVLYTQTHGCAVTQSSLILLTRPGLRLGWPLPFVNMRLHATEHLLLKFLCPGLYSPIAAQRASIMDI